MANKDKIRRTALLCLYCIGNIACYRAGWNEKRKLRINTEFWRKVNGNFLDMASLDWCKLFAEHNGKHHWSKIFNQQTKFRSGLFINLNITEDYFKSELKKIKSYRDKFLAHLDEPTKLYYPNTEIMLKSTMYLYHLLVTEIQTKQYLTDATIDSQEYFDDHYDETLSEIENSMKIKR